MNIAFTTAADGLPRRAFNATDIRRTIDAGIIGEDERFELIEGDIVALPPNLLAHDRIKPALGVAMARLLSHELTLGVAATLQLRHDILVDPDIAILAPEVFRSDPMSFAQPKSNHVLLLVEIAGLSLDYDRRVKARLYARHGITEYWVIDALERRAWIHTGPEGESWQSIVVCGPDDLLTTPALPGFAVRLGEI